MRVMRASLFFVLLGVQALFLAIELVRSSIALASMGSSAHILLRTVTTSSMRGLLLAVSVATVSVGLSEIVILLELTQVESRPNRALMLVGLAGQFLSPLVTSLGCIALVGASLLAYSILGIVWALLASTLPLSLVILGVYSVRSVEQNLRVAACLGAKPARRLLLGARLMLPATLIAFLITASWAYADVVATGLVGSGKAFFPGTLTAYIFQQTQGNDVVYIAVLPAIVISATAAFFINAKRDFVR